MQVEWRAAVLDIILKRLSFLRASFCRWLSPVEIAFCKAEKRLIILSMPFCMVNYFEHAILYTRKPARTIARRCVMVGYAIVDSWRRENNP